MKKLNLFLLGMVLLVGTSATAQDQQPFKYAEGSAATAAMDRRNESSDKVKVISEALEQKGFHRSGTAAHLSGNANGEPCELIIVDYENENGQTASQILQIKNGVEYSAMDIFKEPNNPDTNYGYDEYYVDNSGKLVLTHSFFSCFFNTLKQRCGTIINVSQIWSKCKKFVPFKLGSFFNCVITTAIGQISNFLNCLWSNLWSIIWKCLW